MKSIRLLYLLITIFIISSCKKTDKNLSKDSIIVSDSISFYVDNQLYVFNKRNITGIGNQQVNIKPSQNKLIGRESAYETGNLFWYGDKDSTLYHINYGFISSQDVSNTFEIFFNKKFNNKELFLDNSILIPTDNLDLYKVGKKEFAIDLNLQNTTDGISIKFYSKDLKQTLISTIPGFSILDNSNLSKTIQDDSNFEITKFDKENRIIEANFNLNLFDKSGKLHRAINGFARFKVALASKGYNFFIF
jgi:hypothetical protein